MKTRALMSLMKSLPVVVALTAGLAGCGSGGGTNNAYTNPTPSASTTITNADGSISTTRSVGNLVFTLTAPKRVYALRETVPLTFTVQNTGATDASSEYYYGGPARFANGTVQTSSGRIATYLPLIYGQTANITQGTLVYAAGETKTFSLDWYQNDNEGEYNQGETGPPRAAAGTYKIRAYVKVDNLNGRKVSDFALGVEPLEIEVR